MLDNRGHSPAPKCSSELEESPQLPNLSILVDDAQADTEKQRVAEIRMPSGRQVEVDYSQGEAITVRGSEGEVQLHVRFAAEGPILSFRGARVELEATERLSLRAPKIDITGEQELNLRSGGDLRQEAGGHHETLARGDVITEGYAVGLHSRRGDIKLKANDEVRVQGERIHLNGERSAAWPPFPTPPPSRRTDAERAARGAKFEGPGLRSPSQQAEDWSRPSTVPSLAHNHPYQDTPDKSDKPNETGDES